MANAAYKYRIYPTKAQAELINKTFGCCRKIWNCMLSDKTEYYKQYHEMLNTTPAQYKSALPYLKEVDSQALANVQLHLQAAYRNFFQGNAKFPKYKSLKNSRKSYTTCNNIKAKSVDVIGNCIKLPKVGLVKSVIHRPVPAGCVIKSATVSKDSDGKYYCSILMEYIPVQNQNILDEEKAVGLDYKSDGLYVSSDGEICGSPKYYQKSMKKLAREQRKLSRRQGSRKNEIKSANWEKQKLVVNKLHCKIKHQRADFLHKKSAEITNRYDIICVEKIDLKSISDKHSKYKLGKITNDNGYGMFLSMTAYKSEKKHKIMITVDKYYPSSQICHVCGYRNQNTKNLSVRRWICPNCNTLHERDNNASQNIKMEGLRIYHQMKK